jgi:predicted Fe-Mo cluster-binding NifX family protein
MKIAISATGPNLEADVDPRFGRCQYLIFVDTDTMQFKAQNNANISAGGGAGISTAQTVADQGVRAVLTGNMGPNAHQVLSGAGIPVITGVSGKVRDAIEAYKKGQFKSASQPNVSAHSGMGGGMGQGMGMGRGMGAGMVPPPPQAAGSGENLDSLKTQVETLKQQLDNALQRIADLEGKQR